MVRRWVTVIAVLLVSHSLTMIGQDRVFLAPDTTIPVVFPHTIDGSKAHSGDVFQTHTTADVFPSSGQVVPKGSVVLGHVVNAVSPRRTLLDDGRAAGGSALLAIQFDSIVWKGKLLPLHAKVRAIADPIAAYDAQSREDLDLDPSGDTTQIGGDQLSYVAGEVRSRRGDVVGHWRRHGTYARLLPSQRGAFACGETGSEQAVGLFSADACGVYGYVQYRISPQHVGDGAVLTIVSTQRSPKVWARSHVLLQVR